MGKGQGGVIVGGIIGHFGDLVILKTNKYNLAASRSLISGCKMKNDLLQDPMYFVWVKFSFFFLLK